MSTRIATALLVILTACGARGVEHNAAKSSTRLDLAKDFLRKHELEAAEAESNRSLAFNPSNDEAYLIRGLVHMVRAIDTMRTLEIESCLTGVDAGWANRGIVHNLLEDYPGAAGYFEKALENPMRLDSPSLARAHLGWSFFHQNKLVEAAKELRQAVQFQPNMCVATYRLARVYFAREEWEKAAELFQTASDDTSCGSQEASLYLMKTRMQQGLVDDARRARDACLKLSPRSCIASKCRADGGALGATTKAARL